MIKSYFLLFIKIYNKFVHSYVQFESKNFIASGE